MGENRKRPRFRIANTVRCEDLIDNRPFYTVIRDISSGGIKLTSEDFIGIDRQVRVKINLVDASVEGLGKVVWCNQQPYSNRFQIGIEFTDINSTGQKVLENFIGTIESLS